MLISFDPLFTYSFDAGMLNDSLHSVYWSTPQIHVAFIYAYVGNLIAITIRLGREIQDVQVQTPQPQLAAERRAAQEARQTLTGIATFLDRHLCPVVSPLVIPGALTFSPPAVSQVVPKESPPSVPPEEMNSGKASQSFFH